MLNASASDDLCLTNQLKDTETVLESEDGHGSAFCSVPGFQNIHTNSVASFVTSGETQTDEGKDYSKPSLPSSFYNKKCSYSSVVCVLWRLLLLHNGCHAFFSINFRDFKMSCSCCLICYCIIAWKIMIHLLIVVSDRSHVIQALWLEPCRVSQTASTPSTSKGLLLQFSIFRRDNEFFPMKMLKVDWYILILNCRYFNGWPACRLSWRDIFGLDV